MALANSIRVCHRCRLRRSTCILAQNDSTTALSKKSPIEPIEGTSADWRARWVNAHEVLGALAGMDHRPVGPPVVDGHSQRRGDETRGG